MEHLIQGTKLRNFLPSLAFRNGLFRDLIGDLDHKWKSVSQRDLSIKNANGFSWCDPKATEDAFCFRLGLLARSVRVLLLSS